METILPKIKFPYPTDLIYGLLSAHVADESGEEAGKCKIGLGEVRFSPEDKVFRYFKEERNADINELLKDWEVLKIIEDGSTGYLGILYCNHKDQQLVLAHRSTDFALSFHSNLYENSGAQVDVEGVLMGILVGHQAYGFKATYKALKIAKEKDSYTLSFTGHSLGSWLADLSVFYCHTDLRNRFPIDPQSKFNPINVKAVTFDGPGSYNMMNLMTQNKVFGPGEFNHNDLDIVAYISPPNLVNCANSHIGTVYRLYPELSYEDLLVKNDFMKWLNIFETTKVYRKAINSTKTHEIKIILACFDLTTGWPYKYERVASWPSIKDVDFGKSQETIRSKLRTGIFDKLKYFTSGVIGKIFGKVGSEVVDIGFKSIWGNQTSTLESLFYLLYHLFSGKIEMSQFVNIYYKLDQKFSIDDAQMNGSIYHFELAYQDKYQCDLNTFSRFKVDAIDETILKIIEMGKMDFAENSEFNDRIRIIRLSCVKPDLISNQFMIKEEHRNKIRIAEIRDIVRRLGKKEFDELITKNINKAEVMYCNFFSPEVEYGYVKRERELLLIEEKFKAADNTRQTVVLNGKPGCGKNSLARLYSEKLLKENEKTLIIEFFADTSKKLNDSFRSYLKKIGINTEQTDEQTIMNKLYWNINKYDGPVIFTFLEVEKPDVIAKYKVNIPKNAKLLITTYNPDLLPESKIDIGELTTEEAYNFLRTKLSEFYTDEEIEELINLSGRLLQHLEMIATYFEQNPGFSIEQFKSDSLNYHNSVYFTIFNKIYSDSQLGEEWKLMQFLPYFNSEFVPMELLNAIGINNVIGLRKKSLINLSSKNGIKGIFIDEYIQSCMKKYCESKLVKGISKSDIYETLLQAYVNLFPLIEMGQNAKQNCATKFLFNVDKLMNHLDFDLLNISAKENAYKIYVRMGVYYDKVLHDHKTSQSNYEKALSLENADIRINPKYMVICRSGLAWIRIHKKKYQEGFEYLQQAQKIVETEFAGKIDVIQAETLRNMGVILVKLKQFEEGLAKQHQALEIVEHHFNDNLYQLLMGNYSIGKSYMKLKNEEKGFSYFAKALDLADKLYDKTDLNLAKLYVKLGKVHHKRNMEKSLCLVERGYAIIKNISNKNHLVSQCLYKIGFVYNTLGDKLKSLYFLIQCYKINLEKKINRMKVCQLMAELCENLNIDSEKLMNDNSLELSDSVNEQDELSIKIRIKIQQQVLNFIQHNVIVRSHEEIEDLKKSGNALINQFINTDTLSMELGQLNSRQGLQIARMLCVEAVSLGMAFHPFVRKPEIFEMIVRSSPIVNVGSTPIETEKPNELYLQNVEGSSMNENLKNLPSPNAEETDVMDEIYLKHPEYLVHFGLVKEMRRSNTISQEMYENILEKSFSRKG